RLIAANNGLRSESPVVSQRVGWPDFRSLRPVLVPRARIEVAERLVLHLIHFGEEFHAHLVGIAMIDRDVVPDDVPARPPHQRDVVPGEPRSEEHTSELQSLTNLV